MVCMIKVRGPEGDEAAPGGGAWSCWRKWEVVENERDDDDDDEGAAEEEEEEEAAAAAATEADSAAAPKAPSRASICTCIRHLMSSIGVLIRMH